MSGKYPQLLIASSNKPHERYTEAELDFGSTPIGTSVQKTVEIFNMARVSVQIQSIKLLLFVLMNV